MNRRPDPLFLTPRGFTLIELLVATTLGMVVMTLAILAYQHSQKVIKRSEAVVRLHRKAGDIAEQWERDIGSLAQHVACNAKMGYIGSRKDDMQFTAMRTLQQFWNASVYEPPSDVDLGWIRWSWRAADRMLCRAQSPPPHWYAWYPNLSVAFIAKDYPIYRPVIGMRPTATITYDEFRTGTLKFHNPLSSNPSAMSSLRIFDLLFLTGIDTDGVTKTYKGMTYERNINPQSGDPANEFFESSTDGASEKIPASLWESGLRVPDQTRPISDGVEDCTLSFVTRDGTSVTDAGTGYNRNIDGQGYDSNEPAAVLARPKVLRLAFTLVDSATGIKKSFSFSARAP